MSRQGDDIYRGTMPLGIAHLGGLVVSPVVTMGRRISSDFHLRIYLVYNSGTMNMGVSLIAKKESPQPNV